MTSTHIRYAGSNKCIKRVVPFLRDKNKSAANRLTALLNNENAIKKNLFPRNEIKSQAPHGILVFIAKDLNKLLIELVANDLLVIRA